MAFVFPVLITIHILVCLLMVVVVLMQRPRSEGLGAAFGGGITDNVFGAQTTQVLGRFTTWLAIGFFGITLLLSILTAKFSAAPTTIQEKLMSEPVPEAATPAADSKETPVVETVTETVVEENGAPAPAVEESEPSAASTQETETPTTAVEEPVEPAAAQVAPPVDEPVATGTIETIEEVVETPPAPAELEESTPEPATRTDQTPRE